MFDENLLLKGNSYFLVGYFDNELSIPDIETYIYVGKNILPSDKKSGEDKWYFQDPETYFEKGPFIESQDKEGFDILRADQVTLETMYDLEGLIIALEEIKNKKHD